MLGELNIYDILILVGLVPIFIGSLIVPKKTQKREESFIADEKNNKTIWKILLIIGIIPFAIPVSLGVISFFTDFTFGFNSFSGFEAMFGTIFIWSFLFWPTYIIGGVLIILSLMKIKR